ncbi:MAG TPA: cyclic pyranopterin monophosphate synthase MoaC [Chloroflexota bacterium]|jgi:cyclic pyranopterin phosphate synthase|nr:cyclic pyranopterin monophosphate synthase MoaC [Chloroflexota bacterium]
MGHPPTNALTHLDAAGQARMVDVGEKPETLREAVARGEVAMKPETAALIQAGGVPKGDVLATARLAGIMGAKRTSELIPLCHGLALTGAEVSFEWDDGRSRLMIEAAARTVGQTGVEMEALTAVTLAALTVYDMCKAVDRGMRIEGIRLVRKTGGRSGTFEAE